VIHVWSWPDDQCFSILIHEFDHSARTFATTLRHYSPDVDVTKALPLYGRTVNYVYRDMPINRVWIDVPDVIDHLVTVDDLFAVMLDPALRGHPHICTVLDHLFKLGRGSDATESGVSLSDYSPENLCRRAYLFVHKCVSVIQGQVPRRAQTGASNGNRKEVRKSVRYDVIRRAGFRCQACGASASEPGVKLHVDHIHPVKHGGTNDSDNLQALCQSCNLGKGARICP